MSSRTPEECVRVATDETADRAAREEAIDELRLANECDELANLASNADLGARVRRQALRSLATPQCDSMLQRLAEEESLDEDLQREARSLLEESDES